MSSPADPSGCTGLSWTYDAWGNRPDQTTTGGSCTNFHPTFSQGSNRMDSYSYDAAGNLLSDGTHTYAYDAENRIKSMDSGATTYTYDANGNRIQKTTGSNQWHYFYGEGGDVLVEKNQSGTVLKEYVYGAGQRMERSGGQTYFVHTDYLGSTRTVTNYAGSVTDAMDYLPYGEQIAGSSATTHKFTGQEHDGESGLDYFIARYDASWMGRFTSPDPLAASAIVSNPQTWNRYAYALNNPLRFNDPTGMEGCDATTRAGQENCAAEDMHEKAQTIPGAQNPPALQPPSPPADLLHPTQYSTMDDAGVAAIQRMNPDSIEKNQEFAAWVVQNPNGTYSIGKIMPGTENTSDPGPRPDGAVADAHTHGGLLGGTLVVPANEVFSGRDKQSLADRRVVGYLGTPGGKIMRYDPFAPAARRETTYRNGRFRW